MYNRENPQTPVYSLLLFSHLMVAAFIMTLITVGCNNKSGLESLSNSPQVNATLPADNAKDVDINTELRATFNKKMDPSSINDSTFTVFTDTAAITGVITYTDSTATFIPSAELAASSTIRARITTGVSDMDGNTMASDFEWSFTTSEKSDTDPPQVLETNPANNADDVPLNSTVTATFNEEMDPSTLNTETFLLEMGTSIIAGSVSYSENTAVFSPSENLEAGTIYSATITDGVQDTAGNALSEEYKWDFTTEEEPDNEPPSVTSTAPDDGENNVAIGANVRATFSEPMDPSTISTSTFTLSGGGSSVNGSVSYSDNTATFNPNEDLEYETKYTATITTGAEDEAGNALSEEYKWDFTTEEEPDNEPPSVTSTDPDDGENNVAIGANVRATFSEPMDASTISTSTFTLSGGGSSVNGSVSYSDNTATFNPNEDLEYETKYTATITTGAEDEAGNSLADEYEWDFTTEEEPDNEPPSVTDTFPDDNATNVETDITITATFSEPVDPSTVNENTFNVRRRFLGLLVKISGSVSYSGTTARFTPDDDLRKDTDYFVTITSDVTDLAGNKMADDYNWSFETERDNDDVNGDDDDDD